MAIKILQFTKTKNEIGDDINSPILEPVYRQNIKVSNNEYTFAYTRTDLGPIGSQDVKFWVFMTVAMFNKKDIHPANFLFPLNGTDAKGQISTKERPQSEAELTTDELTAVLDTPPAAVSPAFIHNDTVMKSLVQALITMSKRDDEVRHIGSDGKPLDAPAPPPTSPPQPPTPSPAPTASSPETKPASSETSVDRSRPKDSKQPPVQVTAPPVPPEKALSLPVDGIAMIAGYSKGETAPFALQNVYLKKGVGFGINNDAVVTLKKRYKLIGQPGDIFTLDCTPTSFILIPVVYKKTISEASHWTSAFVQRPGAKTGKSKFAYVAVKNVEWKFEENWIQYGVPEAPRVLLIDYEEAPEGLDYPDDVDLITANQANRVCETISPFDAVATGFMNYLVSSNRDRNPTGIPLYRTQNLNVYMNRFPPA